MLPSVTRPGDGWSYTLRVGAVVARHQLVGGTRRVQAALHDLLQELLEALVAGDPVLQLAAQAGGGQGKRPRCAGCAAGARPAGRARR